VSPRSASETATRTIPTHCRRAELKPEEALREHGEEDEPARQHGLGERERQQRERGDVREEGGDRHEPADRPPLRAEQVDRAAQWVAHVHVGRCDGTAVLVQEGEVRPERRQNGTAEPHNGRR
jgi:hypothetical protein